MIIKADRVTASTILPNGSIFLPIRPTQLQRLGMIVLTNGRNLPEAADYLC